MRWYGSGPYSPSDCWPARSAMRGPSFSRMFGWLGGTDPRRRPSGGPAGLRNRLDCWPLVLPLTSSAPASRLTIRSFAGSTTCARARGRRDRRIRGKLLTVVAIEGYETHFGGLAPFDAHSVVTAHAPILVLSFLTIAVAARMMLGAAIRCAARSGALAAALFTSFLRISALDSRRRRSTRRSLIPTTSCSHVAPEIVKSRGLRAPPHTLPSPT